MRASAALSNVEAYDCWAESYPPDAHNPLMRAEQVAMEALWPDVRGARVLDLACGSGRYARLLRQRGAAQVVAADFSARMLRRAGDAARVRADMMQLPFADATFDVLVCGLAVGHAPCLGSWVTEMARVLNDSGVLLYSDFHPAAAAAGMTRSFTDARNRKHTLVHRRYEIASHYEAAAASALSVEALREVRVGHELQESFSGSESFYRRWQGLPVVLVIRSRKMNPCAAHLSI